MRENFPALSADNARCSLCSRGGYEAAALRRAGARLRLPSMVYEPYSEGVNRRDAMRHIRRLVYWLGFNPRPGSILYSPSIAFQQAGAEVAAVMVEVAAVMAVEIERARLQR